jgi:hypothetical protein
VVVAGRKIWRMVAQAVEERSWVLKGMARLVGRMDEID